MEDIKKIGLQFFADEADPQDAPEQGAEGDGEPEQPERVEMTQSELDALINKAFARGARSARKEAAKEAHDKDEAPDKRAESTAALAKAQRLCQNAALLAAATKAGFIDPADALALADRAELGVDDDGNVDGADEAIAALAKAKPHLIKVKETPPPYASGTGKTSLIGGKTNLGETSKKLNEHRLIK